MRLLRGSPGGGDRTRGRVIWLFVRALGLVYLLAFASLWVQVDGLLGPRGLLPVGAFLERVRAAFGAAGLWLVPTLFWLESGSVALHLAAAAGTLCSLLVLLGIAPLPALAGAWALYLSFVTAGQVFLAYQWDLLLLETGFASLWLLPLALRPRPGPESEPAPAVVFLLRLLAFRLFFGSGVVKWLSGDPAWHRFRALTVHYETQPLPTPGGYWAHQLPEEVQWLCCVLMFVIELVVPFLIFGSRRVRHPAAAVLASFQVAIALTGNYGFFNLLSLALCLVLLDDDALPAWRKPTSAAGSRPVRTWPPALLAGVLALLFLLNGLHLSRTAGRGVPRFAYGLLRLSGLVGLVNPYGLFAIMTTSRREIVLEGSHDGVAWRPYEFRWKPGEVRRRPPFVAPHQPRLDWQMWFAALQPCEASPWLQGLMTDLARGRPETLALLAGNPFPDSPPRRVRALYYDYRFTDTATLRREGAYWRRQLLGQHCPVVERDPRGVVAARERSAATLTVAAGRQ